MIIDQDKMDKIFKAGSHFFSLRHSKVLKNTFYFSLQKGEDLDNWIPVDVSFIKEFWLPDAEILNLKEFKTLDVLSKLEGLWLNRKFEIMYAVATRITFICPMTFNSFPLDVQVCRFQVSRLKDKEKKVPLSTLSRTSPKFLWYLHAQVGSFNYDVNKMIFRDEFIADEKQIRSVLDYFIEINPLGEKHQRYEALTGTVQ